MYTQFFNLSENPFRLTPDPRFLYLSASHREALSALIFGVLARKGFLVVSGDAGTGKTTLVRALLQMLGEKQISSAYVFHPLLDPVDFLEYVLADLGISTASRQQGEMVRALHSFLLKRHQEGSTTALIVDEAHQLPPALLEEIRLLTNLETSTHKLLQVVLAGQSELDTLLRRDDLRQLKQRISLRSRLRHLTLAEMEEYLNRRLALCGRPASELFPAEVQRIIHRYTAGIPRLINSICDNALLLAFAQGAGSVGVATVAEAAADLDLRLPEEEPESAGRSPTAPQEAAAPSGGASAAVTPAPAKPDGAESQPARPPLERCEPRKQTDRPATSSAPTGSRQGGGTASSAQAAGAATEPVPARVVVQGYRASSGRALAPRQERSFPAVRAAVPVPLQPRPLESRSPGFFGRAFRYLRGEGD